ncbi:tol-pal system protein YbgF [Phaeovulum vinaykumarii]|uniref:Cell division coordinator CpoB n=1 Tax=Phaeovulum vinaykumarii TaxID=407234 RepID=A0A1N7K3W8_9RHOB|nr:tol-pal system protein YbgF [Phaeovulum vinaykumarii]SIS56247.1 tol-pal system protein YbgF [Phaeovulum vinaykumarii]SOB92776.1 tol-pal system protein YbgF [Phaeovulum vinaykumarii]
MRRRLVLTLALILSGPLTGPALAQDRAATLADIRAELGSLGAQIQALRGELVASGPSGIAAAGGVTALERMDAMEAALTRLTARSEDLENRINRIVADGTNRLGDLEFRVCELEPACDINAIGATAPLGGAAAVTPAPPPETPEGDADQGSMAINEQADFDRAREVLGQGDFRRAAELLATFAQTYTGSPLTAEAMYLRGLALSRDGDATGAARAWLDAFSAAPEGPRAPDNLLGLGQSLNALGQKAEACTTLGQVGARFPEAPAAAEAARAMQVIGCS